MFQTVMMYPVIIEYFLPFGVLVLIYCIMLVISASFSGLNLAYGCLVIKDLEVLIAAELPQSYQAKKVLPFRKRSNLLIVTFAIGNTLVNIISTLTIEEMLSKFSENEKIIMVNTIPVIMTMLFGEILPQALFSKQALKIAYYMRFFVAIFFILLGWIAWPLSKLLDCVLGTEPIRVYDRKKLGALLENHSRIKDKGLL